MSKLEKYYDEKGNAKHYSGKRLDDIIKYERTYGTLAVMSFCEISSEKYRARLGKKDNQSLEQEVVKMGWYDRAAKFFFERLGTDDEIVVDNRKKIGLPWEKEELENSPNLTKTLFY